MCLNPITIVNPTKFFSSRFKDKYCLQVPCNSCAECQTSRSLEYTFRSYHQFLHTFKNGGYVLFDTLTYSNENLPHLSDFFDCISKNSLYDFPCFNYHHYRLFMVRLRKELSCQGYDVGDNLKVFFVSEYGTDPNRTHRPHYHMLLFVTAPIPPLHLSKTISECWKFGRTDGVVYHGSTYVLNKRVLRPGSSDFDTLAVCRYVSKYVQKSTDFQTEINWRLNYVINEHLKSFDSEYLKSQSFQTFKNSVYRSVCQFHRQSKKFGLSAIDNIDLNSIIKNNGFLMPDKDKVVLHIPLTTYFKRHLFQEQVVVSGRRYWQLTKVGVEFKERCKPLLLSQLVQRYQNIRQTYKLDIHPERLADYVLNYRGQINITDSECRLSDKLGYVDLYSYSTKCDYDQFRCRFVSPYYHGIKDDYWFEKPLLNRFSVREFIDNYVYFDNSLENELSLIQHCLFSFQSGKQRLFDEKQRLMSLFKK